MNNEPFDTLYPPPVFTFRLFRLGDNYSDTGGQTKYIKVKAERDLTLDRVVVTYGGDRTKTIRFDREMSSDKETEWKSLGSRRCVKKIEVYGNSERSKAGVKVFGRKYLMQFFCADR